MAKAAASSTVQSPPKEGSPAEKIQSKSGLSQVKNAPTKALDPKQPKKRDEKAAQKQGLAKPAGSQSNNSPSK